MTRILCAFAAATLAATGAGAVDLTPGAGHSLDLGGYTGVLYYTMEPAGYRVVATIAEAEADSPVRLVSVLADGEVMEISVPREEGQAADLVEIARVGDRLVIGRPASADETVTMKTQSADE